MKITQNQYNQFYAEYFSHPQTKFKNARGEEIVRRNGLRFGQAFVNKFFTEGQIDSKLFYTEDFHEANHIIMTEYMAD